MDGWNPLHSAVLSFRFLSLVIVPEAALLVLYSNSDSEFLKFCSWQIIEINPENNPAEHFYAIKTRQTEES